MKKILLAATAAFLAIAVQAQDIPERKRDGFKPREGHGRMQHRRPGGMEFQKLNLTEDQKKQVREQHENMRKQMEELRKNENITVKELKTRMENLRKEQRSGMEKILTKEQKTQLEKMKSDRKAMHEVDARARAEKMKIRLGLSEDQFAKLEKNRRETGEKMRAIRENKSLSMEQQREQMRELMKKQRESMQSILTEEQKKQMKEEMKRGPRPDDKKAGMKRKMI
ncbi:MAG: hypothetical protein ACO25B_06255 [Chitinophagaceae bacterium]